jgi:hypothetical protein
LKGALLGGQGFFGLLGEASVIVTAAVLPSELPAVVIATGWQFASPGPVHARPVPSGSQFR